MQKNNFYKQRLSGAAFRGADDANQASPALSAMRPYITSLLLASMMVLPRMAAQDAPGAPVKTAQFWKATSGKNVTYLLGSIHVGSKDFYPLPREVEDAFESSAVLVVEVDVNRIDKQKLNAFILAEGLYQGDDLLWHHVNKETKQNIEKYCSTYGLPVERVSKMKPWLLASMASAIVMMKSGIGLDSGIDKHFLDKAGKAKDKKRVVEIESAEFQLKIFTSLSDDLQEKFLDAAMEDVGGIPERTNRMMEAWLSGDPDRVEKLIRESSSGPEQIKKALLQDRNPHMADVAEEFLKGEEQAFVVVGAAHMVGQEGVVAILRNRGFKVELVALKQ